MDALAGLLDEPRARGAFLLRSMLDPPWSVRIQDDAPLSLVVIVRDDALISSPRRSDAVVALAAGGVVLANRRHEPPPVQKVNVERTGPSRALPGSRERRAQRCRRSCDNYRLNEQQVTRRTYTR